MIQALKLAIATSVIACFMTTISAQDTDQVLVTASFFGGAGVDVPSGGGVGSRPALIALESGGWVQCGTTNSQNLWVSPDAWQIFNPGQVSMFLTQFNSDGEPVYSTYFGSAGSESTPAIASLGGDIVIGASTNSASFPLSDGAHNNVYEGENMGTLSRLTLGDELAWSTYVGGSGNDRVRNVAVTEGVAIYASGSTTSQDLGTDGVHMPSYPTGMQQTAFIARYSPEGIQEWFTYYGNPDNSRVIRDMNTSPDGQHLYVLGITSGSADLAPDSHQPQYGGGINDYFLAAFSTADGTLQWETYYGGEAMEAFATGGLIVDVAGLIYFSGTTESSLNIASVDAYQSELDGFSDAFIACFNSDGQRQWASYFGGNGSEFGAGLAQFGQDLLMAGTTNSSSGIVIGEPLEASLLDDFGNFMVKWNVESQGPVWATYLMSGLTCSGLPLIALQDGRIVRSGQGDQSCAPYMTSNAWQANYGGGDADMWYAIYEENTLSTTSTSGHVQLQLYPNPAHDVLYVEANNAASGNYRIIDATGRLVMQGQLQGIRSTIATSHLPQGLYLLQAETQQGIAVARFVRD